MLSLKFHHISVERIPVYLLYARFSIIQFVAKQKIEISLIPLPPTLTQVKIIVTVYCVTIRGVTEYCVMLISYRYYDWMQCSLSDWPIFFIFIFFLCTTHCYTRQYTQSPPTACHIYMSYVTDYGLNLCA